MAIGEYPDANYTPSMAGYSGQTSFRFWCQTVLPLVYDDSLSYYELLNKVVTYLNNVIADVSNVETNVGALLTAYNSLQEYVNTYFDSLDVQEEINNKLDAMATDGTLTSLIRPIVIGEVGEWLGDHITPTTPALDDTLSVANAAAESKTVGDRFSTRTLKYVALNTVESDIDMDNNTYTTGVGSDIDDILSDSFTWTLGQSTGYRLEKYALQSTDAGTVSGSKCYRLYDASGNHIWGGYSLNDSTSVTWYRINTNETEFENAVEELESEIDNGLDDIEGLIDRRTLKNASTYTNAFSMEKNTYYTDTGTNLTGTLGNNFSWSLGTGSYRLEKYALTSPDTGSMSASCFYNLFSLGGQGRWQGYIISGSTDITWFNVFDKNIINYNRRFTHADASECPWTDIGTVNKTCILDFASDVTAEDIQGLPSYGNPISVLTIRHFDNTYTTNASSYGKVQIAWTNGGSASALRRIWFRVSYSHTSASTGPWYEFETKQNIVSNAYFAGTSVMYGQTTGGARSAYNLPAMYEKATGVPTTNYGAKGQGLVKDWNTIYGSDDVDDGYNFAGAELAVFNWNTANDGDALRSLDLGTGDDSEGITTFLGYFNTFMKKMLINYPTMTIVWIGSCGVWSATNPYRVIYSKHPIVRVDSDSGVNAGATTIPFDGSKVNADELVDLTFRFDGFDTVYTITGNTATSSSSADGTITITPALANNVANDTRAIYTDDYTNNDVANGIKSLCEKYRFGYVDMRENNPINKYNYTQIMLNDIVHFTDAGYRKYSETCIAGINRYFAVCY